MGWAIKLGRQSQDMTQKELGKQVDENQRQISSYELDLKPVPEHTLDKIMEVFGLSFPEFLAKYNMWDEPIHSHFDRDVDKQIAFEQTAAGNITDQSNLCKRKQELTGRRWGYRKLIPLSAIVQAHKACLRNRYEIADYLGVTEEFLQDAIDYYRDKYGVCTQHEQYLIYFDPLNVIEPVLSFGAFQL
ncbi:helix-turn-helix transcriptional regulator [Paenibacillus larvae]|nr:helix-turn-helix transcriptional regulator [Paenibacillus larvae]MDR5583397.1 helix-turn-helix transcriptional regulator [Paenibacillus larvae]MDV3483616.1 helix-turn-helix transcriptional regulator [Paenibacillus larvae]